MARYLTWLTAQTKSSMRSYEDISWIGPHHAIYVRVNHLN
jgi:hypothetical protein